MDHSIFDFSKLNESIHKIETYTNDNDDDGYSNAILSIEKIESNLSEMEKMVRERTSNPYDHKLTRFYTECMNYTAEIHTHLCKSNFHESETQTCNEIFQKFRDTCKFMKEIIEMKHKHHMEPENIIFPFYSLMIDYYYDIAENSDDEKYQYLVERMLKVSPGNERDRDRMYMVGYTPNIDVKKKNIEGSFRILGQLKANGDREEYEVKIFRPGYDDKGSFSCSCADFKFKCIRAKTVCKHIIYMVSRVANICESSFYETRILSESQRQRFMEKLMTVPTICEKQKELLKGTNIVFNKEWKPFDARELCSICFDEMGEKKSWVTCPMCTNYMHKECMEVWLEKQQTCVLCRSDCWKKYK